MLLVYARKDLWDEYVEGLMKRLMTVAGEQLVLVSICAPEKLLLLVNLHIDEEQNKLTEPKFFFNVLQNQEKTKHSCGASGPDSS